MDNEAQGKILELATHMARGIIANTKEQSTSKREVKNVVTLHLMIILMLIML